MKAYSEKSHKLLRNLNSLFVASIFKKIIKKHVKNESLRRMGQTKTDN